MFSSMPLSVCLYAWCGGCANCGSFVHALFVFGALVVAVRKLRQGYNTWRFPTGQLTFEFTIKVLRQEDGRDEEALVPQA